MSVLHRLFKKREGKGNLPVQYRATVFKGRLVCVHDIVFKTHPEYFKEPGAWHEILYRKWMYTHAFHKADIIVTVSETVQKRNFRTVQGACRTDLCGRERLAAYGP